MTAVTKVREHFRKFFNPESFNKGGCRITLLLGLKSLILAELLVYIYLQNSAKVGELPYYITDVLIVSISALEFFFAPLFCYMGAQRRRTIIVRWFWLALITFVPLFFVPSPETTADDGFCGVSQLFPAGIPTKAAVRLALLIIVAVICSLGKAVVTGHGLAYLDEHAPSDNLFLNIGFMILLRVLFYTLGTIALGIVNDLPSLQKLIIFIFMLIALAGLYRYPESAPSVDKKQRHDGGLFKSMGRVLGNGLVVLQILVMALLTAAWWGFGVHRAAFVQVRYNIKLEGDPSLLLADMVTIAPVVLGVILAGYMYTGPVMPTFDKKAAASNAVRCSFRVVLVFIGLTLLWGCRHSGVAGAGDSYDQPACGQSCGCDRPWMEYTPVCETEQMTTYFSPCHAGCSSADIFNSVDVFSNCTCAPSGRVTAGACDGGKCAFYFNMHQAMYVILAAMGTLSLTWSMTIVLESVDKRDVAVAVGCISSIVSLFAFVGAHVGYQAISSSTCMFDRDYKCLLQDDSFVPWIGYTSLGISVIAFILSIVTVVLLGRQKKEDYLVSIAL